LKGSSLTNDIYYFAYGMNTNIRGMATRCPGAENLGHVVLGDHKFRFAVHADVYKQKGSAVHGVLWRINPTHLKSLDMVEGYPFYYGRKEVKIRYKDQLVDAIVYFMQPGNTCADPSSSYLNDVMEGYELNSVPTAQIIDSLSVAKKQQIFVA